MKSPASILAGLQRGLSVREAVQQAEDITVGTLEQHITIARHHASIDAPVRTDANIRQLMRRVRQAATHPEMPSEVRDAIGNVAGDYEADEATRPSRPVGGGQDGGRLGGFRGTP